MRPRHRARSLLAAVVVLLAAIPVTAPGQRGLFEADFDEEQKPWSEIEKQLPRYPKPENLIQFDAGAATQHRFYIDAPSLSVDADGVVRYTLVVKTGGGGTNVSFEGMRCLTREQKFYAVGRTDGSWVRARDPQWRRIEYQTVNRHYGVLYVDFFCKERRWLPPAKQIVEALKRASGEMSELPKLK